MGDVTVGRSLSEEGFLALEGVFQTLANSDILLASVDDPDEAKFQRINATRKDFQRICAVVHKVELSEYPDRPFPCRIHLTCQFETFRVDQVDISRGHSQNDAGN